MKKIVFLLIFLGFAACKHRSYKLSTPDMEGTIKAGETVIVEESNVFQRNQVVVFNFYSEKDSKPTPFVKRLIAIPGDSIEIEDGTVSINNSLMSFPPKYYAAYILKSKMQLPKHFFEEQKIVEPLDMQDNRYLIFTSPTHSEELSKNPAFVSITPQIYPKGQRMPDVFPQSALFDWNPDNFGKLWIPKKETIIELNEKTLALYGKIILEKEDNPEAKILDNKLIIKGKTLKKYKFKHHYFFMMGDNRHNSYDSRFWGFVSEVDMIGVVLEELLPE